jgi:hypothetical protein
MAIATGALSVVVGPEPASAASPPKVETASSPTNSLPMKTVVALCPPGKRVIGGGGWVQEYGVKTFRLSLTKLKPIRLYTSTQDGYMVIGAETAPGTTNDRWVHAHAICADPLPGLHIASSTPATASSIPVQASAVGCPSVKGATSRFWSANRRSGGSCVSDRGLRC